MKIDRVKTYYKDKLVFIVEVDHTLFLKPIGVKKTLKVNDSMRKLINKLYEKGHRIILFTGMSWDRYIDLKFELAQFNVCHHELVMGMPIGIYVHKNSFKSIKEYFKRDD